jgi:hypothetical protein
MVVKPHGVPDDTKPVTRQKVTPKFFLIVSTVVNGIQHGILFLQSRRVFDIEELGDDLSTGIWNESTSYLLPEIFLTI